MIEETRDLQYAGRTFSLATKSSRVSDNWVVSLHGIGCAKECFDHVFETGLAKRYSILTFDFVGFGDSDKPEDFEYTLEQHADIAAGLIKQFKCVEVTLVAHSMGGTIGTILARKLDNLTSFINVEGNLVSEDAGIVSRRTAEQTERLFVEHGFDEFLADLQHSDESAFRAWATWYARSSKVAIHRSGTSLVEWSDSGELLGLFNELKDKAFIHGDRTDISHLVGEFKDVRVIKVPNGGHFMMLDNPDAFYQAIEGLLSGWNM